MLSSNDGTLVIAHRGASLCAPQDTMAAFQRAVDLGADGIELDVLFTRDGAPVVAHTTTAALADAPAPIGEMEYADVAALDVGSWFSEEFAGETVPTLEKALGFVREHVDHGHLARVYIHDKAENDYSGERAARLHTFADHIRTTGLQDHVVVMVESGDVSLWQEIAPDIAVTQNWSGRSFQADRYPLQEARELGLRHFSVYHSGGQLDRIAVFLAVLRLPTLAVITGFWPPRSLVSEYQAGGGEFVVFTINHPLLMRLYLDAGFDAIGTDDVVLLRQILEGSPDPTPGLCETS